MSLQSLLFAPDLFSSSSSDGSSSLSEVSSDLFAANLSLVNENVIASLFASGGSCSKSSGSLSSASDL